MSSKPILYGVTISPPVRAVLLTLKALNIDYEFREVKVFQGELTSPEFLAKNPQHTIPTLEDDGKFIWDSHAICAYLVRKYGKTDSLYPKDFYQRAVVDQRLHYENGVLFTSIAKVIGPAIRNRTITKESFAGYKQLLAETYDMMETFLGDQEYFAGDHLTIADLSIVSTVSTFSFVLPVEADKHPKLTAWLGRIQELPYYEEANGQYLEQFRELTEPALAGL